MLNEEDVLKKHLVGMGAGIVAAAVVAGGAIGAPARPASLSTLTVKVSAKKVTLPSSVPAGAVNVVAKLSGRQGELILAKLAPGVTVQKVFQVIGQHHGDVQAIKGYASLLFDRDLGASTTSTQTKLTPGNWAALNVDPKTPVFQNFTVTNASGSSSLPSPSATITERDFRFTGPSILRVGELVRFQNAGKVVHMAIVAKFKSVGDANKAIAYLKAGKDSKAEKLAIGGGSLMDVNSPGAMQQQKIDLKPGTYVLACFMVSHGKEHTRLGMEKLLTITK